MKRDQARLIPCADEWKQMHSGMSKVNVHHVGTTPAEATRLLGATSRPRAELAFGENYYAIAGEARRRTLDAARVKLGEAAFAAALAEGEALSLDDAADAAA